MINFDNYTEPKYSINGHGGIMIGKSEVMLTLFKRLNHLASLPTTVLLRGETGTGKELCAKALHYNSKGPRKDKNFVAVNCAGIPSELLESELFGYTKGAFTGAYRDSKGKFQYADGGTIFLDEIGDMRIDLQAKILRVLQEKQVNKVGGNTPEPVDVRVIAATNKDLEECVRKGQFREDLYYRLNVIPLVIPSLDKRKEDISLIAEFLIQKYNGIYGSSIEGLSLSAKAKLIDTDWKGNVRQLENIIERAFVLRSTGLIGLEDLSFDSDINQFLIKSSEHASSASPVVPSLQSLPPHPDRLWYENGVLPISPKKLSRLKGAKTCTCFYARINARTAGYTENLSVGNKRTSPLLYLTSSTLPDFFDITNTEVYDILKQEIICSKFNQIALKPFKFFTLYELVNSGYAFSSETSLISAANNINAFRVKIGFGFGYALTEENAPAFVPDENPEKTSALITEINKSYQRFRNFHPV